MSLLKQYIKTLLKEAGEKEDNIINLNQFKNKKVIDKIRKEKEEELNKEKNFGVPREEAFNRIKHLKDKLEGHLELHSWIKNIFSITYRNGTMEEIKSLSDALGLEPMNLYEDDRKKEIYHAIWDLEKGLGGEVKKI